MAGEDQDVREGRWVLVGVLWELGIEVLVQAGRLISDDR
jgi:hypothetical protein